ncbi:hypothetical protein L1049_017700 [Liquidambar formosana]|uniref:arogenate dehydratase n=1 Tax=Liquidambar formosana TaxID=63359 RepID=A0AAP0X3X1_LIQFO
MYDYTSMNKIKQNEAKPQASQILQIITIYSTQLPGPNYHCREALAQCELTLTNLGLTRIAHDDTAGAAQIVASEGLRDTGAIASARAAVLYGLDILGEKIQDIHGNVTRFLILAREPIISGTDRPYKTSIVFTLEEGPGLLFKALAVFALREINLANVTQRKRPLRVVDDSNRGCSK